MRLDLHVHTVASDGVCTPEEVVERARSGGLDVIAIADHDTTAAVADAREAAGPRHLEIVPASELSSTTTDGRELHILGYFIDPLAPALVDWEREARALRRRRMERILDRLADQGIEVELDQVLAQAGDRHGVLARPHLARAMVEAGVVGSVPEAFDRYIGDDHPAFVPTALASPADAIRAIREAGGVAVWAHPPKERFDGTLAELVRAGLGGLEVYRPGNRPEWQRRLASAAARTGLVVSGGSDWHDPERNRPLGDFHVRADEVSELLRIGGM